jgi:hypothetical protein
MLGLFCSLTAVLCGIQSNWQMHTFCAASEYVSKLEGHWTYPNISLTEIQDTLCMNTFIMPEIFHCVSGRFSCMIKRKKWGWDFVFSAETYMVLNTMFTLFFMNSQFISYRRITYTFLLDNLQITSS